MFRHIFRSLQSLAFWKLRENYEREKARREFEAIPVGARETFIVFKKEN